MGKLLTQFILIKYILWLKTLLDNITSPLQKGKKSTKLTTSKGFGILASNVTEDSTFNTPSTTHNNTTRKISHSDHKVLYSKCCQ